MSSEHEPAGRTPLHRAVVMPPHDLPFVAAQTDARLKAENDHKSDEFKLANTQKLIDAGVDVNAADVKGETPLYKAVRNTTGSAGPIARLLLDRGADPNAQLSNGSSPLSFVRRFQKPGVVEAFADLL